VTISINGTNYSTIQQAVDAALDGQTIFVSAGTYREQVTVSGKNITIQGAWIARPSSGTGRTEYLGSTMEMSGSFLRSWARRACLSSQSISA
jgi:hypothetical protein